MRILSGNIDDETERSYVQLDFVSRRNVGPERSDAIIGELGLHLPLSETPISHAENGSRQALLNSFNYAILRSPIPFAPKSISL